MNTIKAGSVSALRRYPVKSMLGEDLASADVDALGLVGDRMLAVVDGTGAVGSAKHPRKWGALLKCRARTAAPDEVRVGLADPASRAADLAAGRTPATSWDDARSPALAEVLSELLGRPVAMSDKPSAQLRLERAVPAYAGGAPEADARAAAVDETGTALTVGNPAADSFRDFGPIHLLTAASLRRLHTLGAGDADPRRFRPNIVVDVPGEGFAEDAWVGSRLRVGGAVLEVLCPTPRCIVPTLAQDGLPDDPALMRLAARAHRIPVFDLGPLTCLGVYATVAEPGTVRLGDVVEVL